MPVETLEASDRLAVAERRPEASEMSFDEFSSHDITPPLNRSNVGLYLRSKYVVERLIGCVMLAFFAPIILGLVVAVRRTSPGAGLYWQKRVGLGGRVFKIVKLRTMYIDAEKRGAAWSPGEDDPRVTPLGKKLRKLHLDELPQLWNVACGHMSLIGPRPERPEITKSLEMLIPGYHLRHGIKPGITGLSQVNLEPDKNINSTRRKQILDLRYAASANLWLDCKMLVATGLRMFGIKGDNAMRMTGLKQEISDAELARVGYQFNTPEAELWNPSMGPYDPGQSA